MRLRTFYVKSYRSIVEAKLEDIQNYSVIVGPNNAGKSNLLRAIFVALSIALAGDFQKARRNRQYSYAYDGADYNWSRDIPTALKEDDKSSTVFKLTFEFSDEEKAEFKSEFGINLSKSLQMKFELFKHNTEYNIIMPGRAKQPMEAKMQEIGHFIQRKLDHEYIPCVRRTDFTAEYFSRLINKELEQLDSNPEYQNYLRQIEAFQQPIISSLERRISDSLKTFLPNVSSVKFSDNYSPISVVSRRQLFRSHQIPIVIDDGNKTSIEDKGDGIKSLAAISIVQSLSFEKANGRSLILCIEEPEAHLHPDAIHGLRNVILDIASKTGVQVIISTHSPILVDRETISNNVVVYDNHRVSHCKSISEVREVLGVRTSDAFLDKKVILVEGESDLRYFKKICEQTHPYLEKSISDGSLEFINVHSATKMDYQVKLYNSIMISSLVLLDSDDSGKAMQNKLISTKTKPSSEVLMIKSKGMSSCEIEDIVSMEKYFDIVENEFGIYLNNKKFKQRNKPWSDRLHKAAEESPGTFDDDIEIEIKARLADIVEAEGIGAIAQYDKQYVINLINSIARFMNFPPITVCD